MFIMNQKARLLICAAVITALCLGAGVEMTTAVADFPADVKNVNDVVADFTGNADMTDAVADFAANDIVADYAAGDVVADSTGNARLLAAEDAILLDGQKISGTVPISAGAHTVTARAESNVVCLAVYENERLMTLSFSGTLDYVFPENGAEIVLYRLDSSFQPVYEPVRAVQGTAAQKLVYTGESACYDEWNDYDERDFDDYTVRLKVVTSDGKIIEIRDVGGYEPSGKATSNTNAFYLSTAAAELCAKIISRQSTEGIDAVSGATCASHAILRAVQAALESEPEPYDDGGGETLSVPDGVYRGTAQCLTGYINYMVDVNVTVENGVIANLEDCTLRTPMSTNDQTLYGIVWRSLSGTILNAGMSADNFTGVDAVSGATVSSAGISAAIQNALSAQSPVPDESGDIYAPEGISLYAGMYPVVTVKDGKINAIRIVPAKDTDMEQLEAFAAEIVERQSVNGLEWPVGIQDDAFTLANLVDQILYGKGILK